MNKLLSLLMALLIIVTSVVILVAAPEFSYKAITEIPQVECETLVALNFGFASRRIDLSTHLDYEGRANLSALNLHPYEGVVITRLAVKLA